MLTLAEIADALDTLADIMVSDGQKEVAGYNASFWRDAAAILRRKERSQETRPEETQPPDDSENR